MNLRDILIIIVILGGLLVWPMIFWGMEKICNHEKGVRYPLVYLSIYTEIIIIYLIYFF